MDNNNKDVVEGKVEHQLPESQQELAGLSSSSAIEAVEEEALSSSSAAEEKEEAFSSSSQVEEKEEVESYSEKSKELVTLDSEGSETGIEIQHRNQRNETNAVDEEGLKENEEIYLITKSTDDKQVPSKDKELHCFCKKPWDKDNLIFMIQCDHCKVWYHGSCVHLPEQNARHIMSYHCPVCVDVAGPSTSYKDELQVRRTMKAGTVPFLEKLNEKEFASEDGVILRMSGSEVTVPMLSENGFKNPIIVENAEGLLLRVPPDTFSVHDIVKYVGPEFEVDVIDARRQVDVRMTMDDFCNYFTSPQREKVYNLISLEFSKTPLSSLVQAPMVARVLDLIEHWPETVTIGDGEQIEPPTVSKYCLISSKDSYTDFHIDFGGTSVWYHVLWGEKVFYVVEPTKTNLALYERWMSQAGPYETFFADMVDFCYRIILKKGQTLFIPTGWIHAVLTPVDSLVFGGNFLHMLNMGLQLEVYSIERNLKVQDKYLFPYFETTHWFATQVVTDIIVACTDKNLVLPQHMLNSAKELLRHIKQWTGQNSIAREMIPRRVNPIILIKYLAIAVRRYEFKQQKERGNSTPSFESASSQPLSTSGVEPIKLKIKKTDLSASSDELPDASVTDDRQIANPGFESTRSEGSPRDGIKIKLSLNDKKVAVISDSDADHSSAEVSKDEENLDNEESLHIDESLNIGEDKKRKSHHHRRHHCRHKKHKSKSKETANDVSLSSKRAEGLQLDQVLAGTLNGMEELFKDANYNARLAESVKSSKTSNAMKEAITEIIENEQLPLSSRLQQRKRKPRSSEKFETVHQDGEYCNGDSSDDEGRIKNDKDLPKGKQAKLDVWSPTVKIGAVGRRERTSARLHARVEGVQKGIEAASAVLDKEEKKKAKIKKQNAKNSDDKPSSKKAARSPTAVPGPSSSKVVKESKPRVKKPKKGFATAKQRLGKILKLKHL